MKRQNNLCTSPKAKHILCLTSNSVEWFSHFIFSKLKSLGAAKQWEKQGIERIGRKGEMANKDMTGRRQDTSEVRYSSRTLGLVGGSKRHEQ